MKLITAISIIFAVFVAAQDPHKLAEKLVEDVLALYKNNNTEGLNKMYDENFKHVQCGTSYNKTYVIETFLLFPKELEFFFEISNEKLNGDELKFHIKTNFTHRQIIDHADYTAKGDDKNGFVIVSTKVVNCSSEDLLQ